MFGTIGTICTTRARKNKKIKFDGIIFILTKCFIILRFIPINTCVLIVEWM